MSGEWRERAAQSIEASKRVSALLKPRELEIEAELEALPHGVELSATIKALNVWRRLKLPKHTLHPFRQWVLDEALRLRATGLIYRDIAERLREMIEDTDFRAAAEQLDKLDEWHAEADKVTEGGALDAFIARELRKALKAKKRTG